MKSKSWSEVKTAANTAINKMRGLEDPSRDYIVTIYNDDLPSALKDIATYIYVYSDRLFGAELLVIHNGLTQLLEKGYIDNE